MRPEQYKAHTRTPTHPHTTAMAAYQNPQATQWHTATAHVRPTGKAGKDAIDAFFGKCSNAIDPITQMPFEDREPITIEQWGDQPHQNTCYKHQPLSQWVDQTGRNPATNLNIPQQGRQIITAPVPAEPHQQQIVQWQPQTLTQPQTLQLSQQIVGNIHAWGVNKAYSISATAGVDTQDREVSVQRRPSPQLNYLTVHRAHTQSTPIKMAYSYIDRTARRARDTNYFETHGNANQHIHFDWESGHDYRALITLMPENETPPVFTLAITSRSRTLLPDTQRIDYFEFSEITANHQRPPPSPFGFYAPQAHPYQHTYKGCRIIHNGQVFDGFPAEEAD